MVFSGVGNFVAAVTKWEMLALPMQGENERQWKKVNENTYDISSIKRETKKFLKVHVVVVQSNGKEMCKKKCAARAMLVFC